MKKGRMAKYSTRPVDVEAVQFTGENYDEVTEFLGGYDAGYSHQWDADTSTGLTIATPDGEQHVGVGDWIIRDKRGKRSYYACTPERFSATYVEAANAD